MFCLCFATGVLLGREVCIFYLMPSVTNLSLELEKQYSFLSCYLRVLGFPQWLCAGGMQSWVTTFLLRWRWNILTMAQKALLLCCIFSSWKHVTFSSVAVLSGISCFLELYLFLDQVIISEVCHILIVTYVCRKMWGRVGVFSLL